jgi:hypothetical protein
MIEQQDYAKAFKFIYRIFPKWVSWMALMPDSRRAKSCLYPIEQVMLSALCMFLLRYRSLYSFTKEFRGNAEALHNLRQYFTLIDIPSDDDIRYALSEVSTFAINNLLQKMHSRLERMKIAQKFLFLNKYYLASLDGSGQLSSYNVQCPKCLTRKNDDCTVLYLHGQLVMSQIDANAQVSLTMCYEPIENTGGGTEYVKNDCEIEAAKRILCKLKSLYPKRTFCITADNLLSAHTIVKPITDFGWHFIITAKPDRNKELFSWFSYLHEKQKKRIVTDAQGHSHHYVWTNHLPLKQEVKEAAYFWVNFLDYREYDEHGKELYHNSWITDLLIHENNVAQIARGGRARFTIENRTFNEQKTRGFQVEHNFGHFGNLPNVFFGLAQIAHLISELFAFWSIGKHLIKSVGSRRRFWERLAVLISSIQLPTSDLPIFVVKFDLNTS